LRPAPAPSTAGMPDEPRSQSPERRLAPDFGLPGWTRHGSARPSHPLRFITPPSPSMAATARIIGRMTTVPALWPLPPTRSLRRQRPPSNALIPLRDEDLRLPHAGGSPCILQAHAAPHFSLSVTLSQSTSIVRPALVALPVPFAASQHIPPPDDAMPGTGYSMSIEARWEVPPSVFSAHNSKTTSAFVSDGHCLFCAGPHRLARQRPDSIDSQESL